MRLVWSLVAALGLLVGAGLAQGRFAPPEQVTRPATPHAAILIGETAQPGWPLNRRRPPLRVCRWLHRRAPSRRCSHLVRWPRHRLLPRPARLT